jgi:hypothetical protein
MDGPIPLKPNITPQPPGGADTAGPGLGAATCRGAERLSPGKTLP